MARHLQVDQHEQRVQLRRVFLQPAIAHFGMAELPLEHTERILALTY